MLATDSLARQRSATKLALEVNFALGWRVADRKLDLVTESFSTLDVPRQDRMDFWREMVRRYFVPLRIDPLTAGDFDGTVHLRSIGKLDAARIRANPILVTRTLMHIDRSGGQEYFIALHLHGLAHAEQRGRVAVLGPGDFALFDSARPYRIAFGAAGSFDHLIIRVPREKLDARVAQIGRATALNVKAGSAAGKLVVPALTKLVGLDETAEFVDPILDLISAALVQVAAPAAAPASRQRRTLEHIKRCTVARLASSDLSPTTVARECSISPRQLHRVFEREGTTFGKFVREARLSRIKHDLADPALADLTIAEIGRRHGYNQPAVLTRTFTKHYGTSPRAFRKVRQ